MENDQFRVLAGKDSQLMDLFYQFNPKWAADLIAKKLKGM